MPDRDDVYREFGQTAELAQLLETEIGTVLLAHDGVQSAVYDLDARQTGASVLAAIEKHTLGRSVSEIRKRYALSDDIEASLDQALAARNRLSHGFFLRWGRRIEDEDGRIAMIAELQELRRAIWPAYSSVCEYSQHLVKTAIRLAGDSDPGA